MLALSPSARCCPQMMAAQRILRGARHTEWCKTLNTERKENMLT
jgi:hypothetical protein